ncbi:MAG: SCO family protein [Patescibacteria group bacterium]
MFSKKFIASQVIFLIFLAVVFFAFRPFSREPLPVYAGIAPFELTDSLDRKVSLRDLHGKVWVANFMFTTCSGICPMMTRNMGMIYRNFQNDDALRFVSVSVNPENDSPDVLKKYAEKNGADPQKWIFLTGSRDDIQKLVAGSFKLGDIKEPVFHSSYFALVDRQGRIRGYYDGTEDIAVQKLLKDIMRLRKER